MALIMRLLKTLVLINWDINKNFWGHRSSKKLMTTLFRSSFKRSLDGWKNHFCLVSNGQKNDWMLLDLQWLYGMPRIDTEVESIYPRLLETFALHQRCSYKCGQMMHLSNWTASVWYMKPGWEATKSSFSKLSFGSFRLPCPISKMRITFWIKWLPQKMIFWVFNTHELLHNCYPAVHGSRKNEEVTIRQPQGKGSKHAGYQQTHVDFIFTPHAIKGLSIFF